MLVRMTTKAANPGEPLRAAHTQSSTGYLGARARTMLHLVFILALCMTGILLSGWPFSLLAARIAPSGVFALPLLQKEGGVVAQSVAVCPHSLRGKPLPQESFAAAPHTSPLSWLRIESVGSAGTVLSRLVSNRVTGTVPDWSVMDSRRRGPTEVTAEASGAGGR
jgi:hypothetical protein